MARIGLDAPQSREFVLQATIPLPRGTFPRADGAMPFSVRDIDGTLRHAQVEIVSRFADDNAGADVVEIAARVHRPLTVANGTPLRYDVVFDPHESGPISVADPLEELRRDGAVRIWARDVFGNVYRLDPFDDVLPRHEMRDGEAVYEVRTHGSLMPATPHGGPTATLPHFLGVHAYARVFDGDPVLELDLRVHNGHSGLSHTTAADDPLGKVYFDGLWLDLPSGWIAKDAAPDVSTLQTLPAGNRMRYTIVAPLPGGKMHVMPQQGQTIRRLVITRPADEDLATDYVRDRNVGFARRGTNIEGEDLFSWWNPTTAAYFPQKMRLPDLSHVPAGEIRADLESKASTYAFALRTGIATGYPILAPAFGWAHPLGTDSGGMAGGDGIVMVEGLRTAETASNAGLQHLAMVLRMYTDRHPVALYDMDGEPSQYESWIIHDWSGAWLPTWYFLTPLLWAGDPFGFGTAPQFQVNYVAATNRKPDYEDALAAHQPIDFEHFVRLTSPAKALVWLANDSLAKDCLFQQAAVFRMSYNDMPNSQYGHYIPTGLAADEIYVGQYPAWGMTFGRLESWGIDAVAAAYCTADPAWRAHVRPWFLRIVDLLRRGQSSCSGVIEAMVYEQFFNEQYRTRQSIEQAITENMLVSVRESVVRGVDAPRLEKVDAVLRNSTWAMIHFPCWNEAAHAPWTKLAMGDNQFSHAPFCGNVPSNGFADGGDSYQCWNSFVYGYQLTGHPLFLQRAAEMAGGGNLLQRLLQQGLENIENRAALLAYLQLPP